jgi:molybdenum cofactor biosynthesis protein MoaC
MGGRVRMIDVGGKPDSVREAVAKGTVKMQAATFKLLREGALPKGDVLAAAQVAGIMAAKQTPGLLPLCHPLLLSEVKVDFALDSRNKAVNITAAVKNTGKTGVEMEALTARCGSRASAWPGRAVARAATSSLSRPIVLISDTAIARSHKKPTTGMAKMPLTRQPESYPNHAVPPCSRTIRTVLYFRLDCFGVGQAHDQPDL